MEASIEVRSLEGESITLPIPPNASIADLKRILKESFLPAKNHPNFHLFFKGSKLGLHSRLDCHQISDGKFIVLVPFAKKSKQLASPHEPVEENTSPSMCSQDSSMALAADSAWLDMMGELSHMSNVSFESVISNTSNSLNQSSNEKEVLMGDISEPPSTNTRKKRKVDSNRSLCDILSSDSRDVFDQQSRIEISRVVGSVNCLSNANTGGCLLIERFGNKHGNDSCICPSWLKKVLKCFSFLNIFYAFFHAQCKPLTWAIIEEALKHSSDFGLDDVFVSDVESLSILCPKSVVILGKQHTMERPGSAITIGDSSFEAAVPGELQKKHRIARKCTSTLVNAIEKRGSAFRTDLWRLIETRQLKNSLPLMWSLDDLLTVAKDCFRISEQNKVKSHKPRVFASKCHVGFSTPPPPNSSPKLPP